MQSLMTLFDQAIVVVAFVGVVVLMAIAVAIGRGVR